jgi:hypothetical protein
MYIETIFVNRDGVKVIVNKSDFNPEIEKIWSDGPENDDAENAEKDKLIAELAELGVKKDRRSSVEALKSELEKAINA